LTYTYGMGTNKLTAVADAVSTTASHDWDAEDSGFSYDLDGNMISSTKDGVPELDHVVYNTSNLPIYKRVENTLQALYQYNASGWRFGKEIKDLQSGATTEKEYYILDGNTTLAVTDAGGNVSYWNMYGNELLGRQKANGEQLFYVFDYLGSTRRVYNGSSQEVASYNYYPFGAVMHSSLSEPTKETFTGKGLDTETGRYYFGARYYDAGLGRWSVTDPAGQFASPYGYAGNPVSFTDPDGEFFLPVVIGAAIGASLGSMRAGMTGENPYHGMLKGAVVGGASAALGAVTVGSSFAANFAMGVGQGASIGTLDAALWGGDIGKSALHGGVSGGVFATLTSPQLKNALKGQGFRSNQKVFADFVEAGDFQEALDHFGFEGTYQPDVKSKNYQATEYWGRTTPKGEITYGNLAFEDYQTLKATYIKENYHASNIKVGKNIAEIPKEFQGLGFDTYLEEIHGYIHAYKNQGLFLGHNFPFKGVEFYQWQLGVYGISHPTYPQSKILNFIYRIPRRF